MSFDCKEAMAWWEVLTEKGRNAWMLAAGYSPDIASFAERVPWWHLPDSCQDRLQETRLPVDYE
jgi:hypothetical protein